MSSGVILLQRPYISFSSPLLLILRWEITAAAVALFRYISVMTKIYGLLQLIIISCRALAEMMPVCVCALDSHADFSKTNTATDFL